MKILFNIKVWQFRKNPFHKILNYFWSPIKWIIKILLIVLCAVFIKIFIMDFYNVPSESMEESIFRGDYVTANKLLYGSKLPQNPMEIPWFNLFSLNDGLRHWFRETKWPYKRWPNKIDQIKRNDIIIFEGPWRGKKILIKRCKGLPRDLLLLKSDSLFINNVLVKEPKTVKYIYNSTYKLSTLMVLSDLKEDEIYPDTSLQKYQYKLHPDDAEKVRNLIGQGKLFIKPYQKMKNNNYGPIQVPAKGLIINLNHYRHVLFPYIRAIKIFEGSTVQLSGDNFIIDGKTDSLYTFKNDYYFMMGDNRHSSLDSRDWGFIPEQNIIAKSTRIWFSKDVYTGKIRWNRIFKAVQ